MQIVALLFVIAALVSFVLAARPVVTPYNLLAVGLFFLTAAWVTQTVVPGGWHWLIR